MATRERTVRKDGIRQLLVDAGLIEPGDRLVSFSASQNGNMTLVRVSGEKGAWIVKLASAADAQSEDLSCLKAEIAFYRLIAGYQYLSRFVPSVVYADEDSGLLVLEEISEAHSFSGIYKSHHIDHEDLKLIVKWLSHLHRVAIPPEVKAGIGIRRKSAAISRLFSGIGARDLSDTVPASVVSFLHDPERKKAFGRLKELLLAAEDALVHGGFVPANWLANDSGIYFIDPKYCHAGKNSLDLASMVAHLCLASIPIGEVEAALSGYENPVTRNDVYALAGLEMIRVLDEPGPSIISRKSRDAKFALACEMIEEGSCV